MKKMQRGQQAIDSDRPLYVWDLSGRWVRALSDTTARERAKRMLPHALWIYGVEVQP